MDPEPLTRFSDAPTVTYRTLARIILKLLGSNVPHTFKIHFALNSRCFRLNTLNDLVVAGNQWRNWIEIMVITF